jgi:hypothetical protein
MGNPIKYSATVTSGSYNKGNVAIGTNTIGFGPTSTTGWYNSITPTGGNFVVIEVIDTNTPPRFYYPTSEAEWIRLAKQEGATGINTGSAAAVRNWFASQTNYVVTNIDFPPNMPSVVGNGLILNLDAKINTSYPGSGTTWTDISGLGNNGILVNSPSFNSGEEAIIFDGADDYGYIPNTANIDWGNQISFGILFYNRGGDYRGLINQGYYNTTGWEWRLGREESGRRLGGFIQNTSNIQVFSEFLTNLNRWNFVYLTYDGSYVKGYLNGVLQTTASQTGNIKISSQNICIGMRGLDAPGEYFNDGIQIAQIYNRALTQAEVLQNYYQAPIVTDGLVFAADAGNLVSYDSGSTTTYSLTGSISGSLLNGTGYLNSDGGVWDLDGSDDRIALGYQPTMLTSDITQEAWVKADNMYNWSGIISNMPSWGTGFSLQIGPIQNIAAMVSGVYLTTSWAPKTGVWYHILATHRSSDDLNVLYVNGVQENSFVKSISYSANAVTEIGVFYTGGGLPIDGKIGLVRTYNRALTAAEALQNFNAQRSRFGI